MPEQVVKLKGKTGLVPTRLFLVKNKYHAYFPFDERLKDDIKAMRGSRWNPEEQCWTFQKCRRNDFQLSYLLGLNPYDRYDGPIKERNLEYTRPLFDHQKRIVDFILTRQQCIVAAEMGTGKTLAGIELIEHLAAGGFLVGVPWWVGPKLTLSSVRMELQKWGCLVTPMLMTYDKMRKLAEDRLDPANVPNVVIFDESSKLKGHASQRTKSAIKLGELMREVHGDPNTWIVLFSGRPAPNAPVDWWAQCEVACPGFLREGKYPIFEERLCLKEECQTLAGDTFQKRVTWWDDPQKCRTCGKKKQDHKDTAHPWVPSVNEVEKLERRLRGLVLPIFKKDCLDLPNKTYLRVTVAPNPRTKMLARQLTRECVTPGDLMYKLRALSDGYVVKDIQTKDTQPCRGCSGTGKVTDGPVADLVDCAICKGEGRLHKFARQYEKISSPKLQAFTDILDNYADLGGRLVVWAPLYGTLDILRETCKTNGWNVIQFDGRACKFYGVTIPVSTPLGQEEMLRLFQEGDREDGIVFLGNPEAAGMGLTLTAADAMVFYSNSWKPEARTQAEDRIHRPGSRGAKIIDILCMPIDRLIVEALDRKESLQDLSLGKVVERLERLEVTN